MVQTELDPVVGAVLRTAQRQGYVVPRDVRAELTQAGLPLERWKEVLDAARESLHYRKGRYHFIETVSPRLQEQQRQQEVVFHAVRDLIRRHQEANAQTERRGQDRIDFIHPARVVAEDSREFRLLTRDLSPTGIRLLGNRSLLGQKINVHLTPSSGGKPCAFVVRILWTCAVGDDLFENGGVFMGLAGQ